MKSSQQKIRELWEDNNGKLIITRIHPQYYHVIRTDITFIFFSLTTQKSPLFLLSTSQCDALHHISSTITSFIICVLLQHFSYRWCFLKFAVHLASQCHCTLAPFFYFSSAPLPNGKKGPPSSFSLVTTTCNHHLQVLRS